MSNQYFFPGFGIAQDDASGEQRFYPGIGVYQEQSGAAPSTNYYGEINQMSGLFKKNTAVTGFTFCLATPAGVAVTSGTTTGYYTLDGGTQATVTASPAHEGNGQWSVNLTAGEMNGDIVGLLFTNSSAVPVNFNIVTDTKIVSELNDIAATSIVSSGAITTSGGAVSTVTSVTNQVTADVTAISGDTVAANNLESDYDGNGYNKTNSTIGTATTVATTLNVNVAQISGDTAAADNLEADYDGTGYNKSNSSINGVLSGVTVATNNDKTGYSISGTKTTLDSLNDITAANVWAEATRTLTAGTNIVLAKGVGITGFNDIAATEIVSGGAITTASGLASSDTKKINAATVTGNGTSSNLWRGA